MDIERFRLVPLVMGLILLVLLLSCGQANSRALHHDLAITLHPDKQELDGTDTLTIASDHEGDIVLRLSPDARVTNVSISGGRALYVFHSGELRAHDPNPGNGGEKQVTVTYAVPFRDPVPVSPLSTEDPGYGVTGTISPQGVMLLSGSGWYPDIPDSTATFTIRVRAPKGIAAVTAGKRVALETDNSVTTSIWETVNPLPGIPLAAGRFSVKEETSGDVPVYTYFLPGNHHLADRYLQAASNHLRFYATLFGPYPFPKFAVVENFFPTGYGFPSFTLIGGTVLRLPFIPETSLAHEIAHSWWGNAVQVDPHHGNWAEGLTTYVADYLIKEKSSEEEGRDYRLQILRDYSSLVTPRDDFPLEQFTGRSSPATRSVGYGKGAMIFHMARRLCGDAAFWNGLRSVFAEKSFQTANWNDFAQALKRASGRDMASFFEQWVERPGAPTLSLASVRAERFAEGWQVTGQIRQGEPLYDLEVPLRLQAAGETALTRNALVRITGAETPFSIQSDAPPSRLVADPDADLFRRLHASEVPPTVNRVRGASSLLVVAAKSIAPEVVQASRTLLAALGLKDNTIVMEDEVHTSALDAHDVLYLGPPESILANPGSLPQGISLSSDGFSVDGTSYTSPEDALFLVIPNPRHQNRIQAVFLPLSASGAESAARKIPHYGKYSYLTFHGGTNHARGVWPVTGSPLIHQFTAEEVSS